MLSSLHQGYRAVVTGASGGIGSAIVAQLARDPRCGEIIPLSRARGFDLLDESSVAARAKEIETPVDLVFDATGALRINGYGPEKSLRALDPAAMAMQFATNAIGPALILKHFAPLLPRERRALVATLSARVGSIGDNRLGGWVSYRAAKAALNQIVRTGAIEIGRTHPLAVVVALHPGTVATPLSESFAAGRDRLAPETSASALLDVLDALPREASGGFFAYDGTAIEW